MQTDPVTQRGSGCGEKDHGGAEGLRWRAAGKLAGIGSGSLTAMTSGATEPGKRGESVLKLTKGSAAQEGGRQG